MSSTKRSKREQLARSLLPPEELDRIDAYAISDDGMGTDEFGTSHRGLASFYVAAYWLHRSYFRVWSTGHQHVPATGAAVVVGNHSGVLPFDGVMVAADLFRNKVPPRLLRMMVDYFVFGIPWLGTMFRELGQIAGTRHNFDGLIEAGHLVGVFPEGAAALGKPAARRYELFPFSHGHVELAARHRVPVVPFGLVGAEEQQTVISEMKPLARALGIPYVPITTTFPWLGPLGLLPKPVRYFIHYGPPLTIDPDVLHSMDLRRSEVARVRRAVNGLIDVGRETRSEVEP